MTEVKMQLEDWLDDLCVRFIINLPREELESVERICFQVEEAQWFYEDFIRPLDPALPSLSLKAFALRIFQHCPLMANWSRYHHMTAFSEFLAYKTRVPVRGAIMLNQDMDEVVLVKGWKKGANWSFPRGKINKDEKDLDCAIREVYEETGYDIREAGLVKDETDVKFIEITMREQHMRLYVFRGVPKDAYFEPRTRKEISKIEWYKLSELPTLKKSNKQYDQGLSIANANKFYMVAPFMHPLKKWIAQQKRLASKGHADPKPYLPTDGEISMDEGYQNPSQNPGAKKLAVPSDLPEVATSQEASLHLRRLLNINSPAPTQQSGQTLYDSDPNTSKSNALLELLRSASSRNSISQSPGHDLASPPHHMPAVIHTHHQPFLAADLPPGFPGQYGPMPQIPSPYRGPVSNGQHIPQHPFPQEFPPGNHPSPLGYPGTSNLLQQLSGLQPPPSQGHPPAPYQQTGDPQFAHSAQPSQIQGASVPPASKLPPPKLTSHSLTLLSVFKDDKKKTPQTPKASLVSSSKQAPPDRRKSSHHQDQLLSLLRGSPAPSSPRPAELSGHPVSPTRKQILQRPNVGKSPAQQPNRPAWTAATVSGPFNLPQFEAIPKSSGRKAANVRSRQASRDRQAQPLASPITILPRPQSAKKEQTSAPAYNQSPRASPKPRTATSKSPEPPRLFQPQILRRSDNPNASNILPMATKDIEGVDHQIDVASPRNLKPDTNAQSDFSRRPSQTTAQRETLLSLFGKPAPSPKVSPAEQLNLHTSVPKPSATPSIISPLSPVNLPAGNGISSDDDNRTSNANIVASPVNKAFLLGFLEGVAKGNR